MASDPEDGMDIGMGSAPEESSKIGSSLEESKMDTSELEAARPDDVPADSFNEDEPQLPTPPELILTKHFRDHFTLPTPSNTVRYRSAKSAARVFENGTSQFIMEETLEEQKEHGTYNRKIQVKQLNDATKSLQFLRFTYTIVCVLWTGLLLVFCLQVLLNMVLELAVSVGQTSLASEFDFWKLLGVVFGLFAFCKGFASGMVISSAFVADAWDGHFLMKKVFFARGIDEVFVDWIFFAFFVFFPIVVLCATLYSGTDQWWTITALFWFACIAFFFVVFAITAVAFEVNGAITFVRQSENMNEESIWPVLKRCVLFKQMNAYSGKRRIKYIAQSCLQCSDDGTAAVAQDIIGKPHKSLGLWSRFTLWRFLSRDSDCAIPMYKHLHPPQRLFTIEDVQDFRPFITKNTWSLERMYCRPRNSRYVSIVKGPGALTPTQMQSSFVCGFLALVIYLMVVTSVLVWFEFGAFALIVGVILYVIVCYPAFMDNLKLMRIVNELRKNGVVADDQNAPTAPASGLPVDDVPPGVPPAAGLTSSIMQSELNAGANQAIYIVSEHERVTQVTERFCWVMMALEVLFFFVYPAVTLFSTGNIPIGVLFLVVAGVSFVRYYLHLVTVIEETGNMKFNIGKTPEERWAHQSRLSGVIRAISYDKSRFVWNTLFAGFGLFIVGLLLGALGSSTDPNASDEFTFLPRDEYYYPPKSMDVRYQTCNLSPDVFGPNATLVDFAFMSKIAYHADAPVERELQAWFGDTVVSEQDSVKEWRSNDGKEFENSPVFFRFFRHIPTKTGIISVRGTQNAWDLLADSQLWSTAMLVQGLRLILPIGEIWTPVLDELVLLVNLLQSQGLSRISFYRVTTAFVNDFKNDPSYDSIKATGHSLGGGIAIITGAQAKVPAVAVSGPNAWLSGSSFDPKVTHEQLDHYTFNIVPARDPVARFDIVANQFQNIRCNAAANRFVDCHFADRSLCEILYTCGSGPRPVMCECYTKYKFEKPTALPGARDIDEICETSSE